VKDNIDVGGLKQPVIGQRRVIHDLRVKEGEISLLGGLMQGQDLKSISGFPGLADVPFLKRLFSSESIEKSTSELLVVLIPHIVRSPEINEVNLRGIAAGNDQSVKINYASRRPAAQSPAPGAPAAVPPPATAPAKEVKPPAPEEPKPAAPSGSAILAFNPPALSVKASASFTVTLQVFGTTDLAAAPMRLKFDPKLLRLTSVERGNLLALDGQQPLFTRNIQNDEGEVSVNLNRLPGAGGVTGSGALATFTFEAVAPGAAMVTFTDLGLRNSQNQPMAAAPPTLAVTIQ
jgi:general secretion pathway protein D